MYRAFADVRPQPASLVTFQAADYGSAVGSGMYAGSIPRPQKQQEFLAAQPALPPGMSTWSEIEIQKVA